MKRRCLSLLLTLLVVLGLCVPVMADFPQQSLNSVVAICEKVDATGNKNYVDYGLGTGFFIGEEGKDPEYIVTNCHVISDFLVTGGGQTKFMQLDVAYDENDIEEAYVVDYNSETDLAVLRLDAPTSKRAPLNIKKPSDEDIGSIAYAIGYPSLADADEKNVSKFSMKDATVTSGSISRLTTEAGTGRRVVQIDLDIKPGNSGGPLVDENGSLLGINTFLVQDNENGINATVKYAVSSVELIPLLERNNISYSTDDGSRSFVPALVGIAAAIIIAVILILLIMLIKKKSGNKPVNAGGKKGPKPIVRSLALQHNGLSLPLSQEPLIIGRDPSASMVFGKDTAGVSRRHCTVSYDFATGDFILIDIGSSYGTFLNTGQRLESNKAYRLRAGDSFYIGERINTLRFELE